MLASKDIIRLLFRHILIALIYNHRRQLSIVRQPFLDRYNNFLKSV